MKWGKAMSSTRDAADRFAEGERLLRAGNYDAAIAEFSAAITLRPDYRLAYRRRAEAYRRLGMEEQARADRERAESILEAGRPRSEPMTCSSCGKESPAGARYCTGCGADLLEGRRRESFHKAFAWTAIPIVALSVFSTAGAGIEGFYFGWFAAAAIWVIALLVAITVAVARAPGERRSASGILAGIGVGAIALATTCFANLATFDLQL